jgi:hypothetical protein
MELPAKVFEAHFTFGIFAPYNFELPIAQRFEVSGDT